MSSSIMALNTTTSSPHLHSLSLPSPSSSSSHRKPGVPLLRFGLGQCHNARSSGCRTMSWLKRQSNGRLDTKAKTKMQVSSRILKFSDSQRVLRPPSTILVQRQRGLRASPLRALNKHATGSTPTASTDLEEETQGNRGQPTLKVLQEASAGELANEFYQHWNSLTEQLAASATFAFLLLQLPQIILNTKNLLAGNNAALFAVPWMGLLTGLLGNLSLLSYFAGKKEKGAMIVQAVGVLSTFLVQVQLAIGGAMPIPAFIATAIAVGMGYIINFLNYNNLLSSGIWRLWQDTISIGGVSVLPQVMWSTFDPYLPPSLLPGKIALAAVSVLILLDRMKKLPKQMETLMGGLAAWSATFLFMWGPVAQMWTNIVNPSNIQGLSVFTILLAMIGNSLLLPRALFTRDLMWFTGSSWGALLQGWGILLTMYIYNCIGSSVFFGVSFALALWLGGMLALDSKAYSLASPAKPLVELFSGSRVTK